MKKGLIFCVLFFVLIAASVFAEQTQLYSKIFLSPYYREATTANTEYNYTISVNPPDGLTQVYSATITFEAYFSPSVNVTLKVNNQTCNTPNFYISTTYSGSAQMTASFDCSNIIKEKGNYSVQVKMTKNTGAINSWLDLTYTNKPIASMEVFGTEYSVGQTAKIWLQLLDSNGTYIDDGACFVDIYKPDNTIYIEQAQMTPMTHDGVYYYDLLVPLIEGVYPAIARCYYEAVSVKYYPTDYFLINATLVGGWVISNLYTTDGNVVKFKEVDVGGVRRLDMGLNITNMSSCLGVSEALLTGVEIYTYGRFDSIVGDDITISVYNYTSASWQSLPNKLLENNVWKSASNTLFFNNLTNSGLYNASQGGFKIRFTDTNLADGGGDTLELDNVHVACNQLAFPQWQEVKGSSELHVSARAIPTDNEFVEVSTCDGYLEGKCAIMTNDGEFNYTEGELEDWLNFTALVTRDNTNIIYYTPMSVDCTALYWIKEWNGTDWVDFTDYTSYSKSAEGNCEIDLHLNLVYAEQRQFRLKYDNFMKWEVDYSKDAIDSMMSIVPDLCNDRNFTYEIPILEASNMSSDPLTDMCHHIYDDNWWANNYYNLSLLAENAGEYSPYLVEMRLYREELYRRISFVKSVLGGEAQTGLLNQIWAYLTDTIYPYLQQIWNKLLGIEAQLNTTISITNQSLVLDTEINQTTHGITDQINNLNTSMQEGFAEKDAHIQSAYDNMTLQVADLKQNTSLAFDYTWQLIQQMNQTAENTEILSYLQNITLTLNSTQAQINNVNQSLSEQISNTSNTTQALINNLNISDQARFDQLQSFLENLSVQLSQNQNITQQNLSDLQTLMLSVNMSLSTDISNLNVSLYDVRSDLLQQINQSYIALNQSINQTGDNLANEIDSLRNLMLSINQSLTQEIITNRNTILLVNQSLSSQIDSLQSSTSNNFNVTTALLNGLEGQNNLTHQLLGNLSLQLNQTNWDIQSRIDLLNQSVSARFDTQDANSATIISLLNNLSIDSNTSIQGILDGIANLSVQVDSNHNITQSNISTLLQQCAALNITMTGYYQSLYDALADMNLTLIYINDTNTWIITELNISSADLNLVVTAPNKCLADTNWLAKAQVKDRFGNVLSYLDGIQCNMTTDLWPTENMSYAFVDDRFRYIHVCDPANTTFNWSVSCGRT